MDDSRILQDIDSENKQLIESMSPEEIQQAIADIRSSLPESLLSKLTKKTPNQHNITTKVPLNHN